MRCSFLPCIPGRSILTGDMKCRLAKKMRFRWLHCDRNQPSEKIFFNFPISAEHPCSSLASNSIKQSQFWTQKFFEKFKKVLGLRRHHTRFLTVFSVLPCLSILCENGVMVTMTIQISLNFNFRGGVLIRLPYLLWHSEGRTYSLIMN